MLKSLGKNAIVANSHANGSHIAYFPSNLFTINVFLSKNLKTTIYLYHLHIGL